MWGASSSNASNGRAELEHLSCDEEAAVADEAELDRQHRCSSTLALCCLCILKPTLPLCRLRARMQSRSARAKPWASKSPRVSTPPTSSNRSAFAGDRSQLAADILNEDRVALAARLRDPGDDPPPNYFREPTAADDDPSATPPPPHFPCRNLADSSAGSMFPATPLVASCSRETALMTPGVS